MEVKMFEILDQMTFFAVVAVLMEPTKPGLILDGVAFERQEAESYLLRRSGYQRDSNLIAIGRADAAGTPFHYDPHGWGDRTMRAAHAYIEEHWHQLLSGQVIDVEHVLGEVAAPKKSERHVY